jgi:hypothetical protein
MTDKEVTFVLNCYRDMAGKDLNDVICVPSKDMIAIVDYVRQQKEKICKLKEKNSNLTYGLTSLRYDLASARGELEFLKQDALTPVVTKIGDEVARREKIKAEAIKEFAEQVTNMCDRVSATPFNKTTAPSSWSSAYEMFAAEIEVMYRETVGTNIGVVHVKAEGERDDAKRSDNE